MTNPHKPILDHVHSAIMLLDESLRVVYVNPAAEALLEASAKHLIGRELESCFVDSQADHAASFMKSLQRGHHFTQREATLLFPGGRRITVDLTVTPMTLPGQRRLLIEIQQLDRMLKIAREENLLQNQQAARALARGVAHEIKNPLGGIRGAAQLLSRKLDDAEAREYTRVIMDEADRLTQLADQLLGPRTPPRFEPVNIHEIFEHVRNLISVEYPQLSFVRDYDISIPDVEADRDQLIQVILNVVRNAAQALTENAIHQPRIIMRSRVSRQFTIGSTRHKLVLHIDIIDNGPGIPRDMLESIFYPLITGRAQGTGLGLSIAQGIVASLDGLIECESQPGETCFTVLIPIIKRRS